MQGKLLKVRLVCCYRKRGCLGKKETLVGLIMQIQQICPHPGVVWLWPLEKVLEYICLECER